MMTSFRRFRPLPLLAAAVLSFTACNGDDSPLAPQATTSTPAAEPSQVEVAAAPEAALTTTGRIAFLSKRLGGYWSAYRMDPAGTNLLHLTKTGNDVFQPAWSYNNKLLAVVRDRSDGFGAFNQDIWLVSPDGTNGHWLRKTMSPWNLGDPSWAPDGSHLLVSLYWVSDWYLAKIEVASGNITLLHPVGGGIPGRSPSYDKAGKRIVYVTPNRRSLVQLNPDGSGAKTLYQNVADPLDLPHFSPDGGRLVFQKGAAGSDIVVKNLGTGVVTKLTSSPAWDGVPTWSPDGTRLAFASSRSGVTQIYTMTATGANQTRITHTSTDEWWPSWTH